ncbi:MAG: flavodoxin family protein [Fibrobacter sp.]|jgi:multimeric flavodoxin WrbA|nr:flavodoxin family protein [Fibrobacter sp.]
MKVLLINGSPRQNGNTAFALSEAVKVFEGNQIQTEMVQIGTKPVQGCINCRHCKQHGVCVFKDELYLEILEKIQNCDALILGTPVYYAGANGSLCAVLDRIFYSVSRFLEFKPGAAIAVCRRGGAGAAFDRLNKYFTITNMPVVPSTYWNIVYGRLPGEAAQDKEGLQTVRNLARNMVWMLNSLDREKRPAEELQAVTNFVR